VGIQEVDSVDTILDKMETGIRVIGEELAWTVPFIRSLLSHDPGDPELVTMSPLQRRGRTVEALRAHRSQLKP
jgi:hypothetical protein